MIIIKGIILAAGRGTRLYPMTHPVPKPLIPVYDKPMIYYPLSVLIQLGVTEVLIVVPPNDQHMFESLLGDGSKLGISITYKPQFIQKGIADALLVGEDFIGDDSVLLMLGDNIFFNDEIKEYLAESYEYHLTHRPDCAMVLGIKVTDPWRFGVIEFDSYGKVIAIEEKPLKPKSNYITPGFYYYPNDATLKAKSVVPSISGELEITSVNQAYLVEDRLYVKTLPDGVHWYDTGNADSLMEAAKAVQNHQRYYSHKYIGCIEEEAAVAKLISMDDLLKLGEELKSTRYGAHIIDYAMVHKPIV